VGKTKGNRPLGNPWHIKTDFKETGQVRVDWVHLTQDTVQWQPLVNTVMNIRAHNIPGISRLAGKLPASEE